MRSLLPIVLLLPSVLHAQFEGTYETRNLTSGETGGLERFTMTVWVKDARARIVTTPEGGNSSTTMIYRADLGVIWMLDDARKTFFEFPREEESPETPMPPPAIRYRVKRTGKSARIAGYACEQVLITTEQERTELWGTARLLRLSQALEKALGTKSAAAAPLGGEGDRLGLFPLKSTTSVEGNVVESQEVIRVAEQEVEDSLFSIPPGYVKRGMNETLEEQSKKPE